MRPRTRPRPCDDQLQGKLATARRNKVIAVAMRVGVGLSGFALLAGVGLVTISYKLADPSPTAAAPVLTSVSPARVQVVADEFTLVLSRGSIQAGPAIVELVNIGEDEHDLALRRVGKGAVTRRITVVAAGDVGQLSARLRAGRFVLWCTLIDHRARGMRATLTVR